MNKLCNYSLDGAGFNRYMVECECIFEILLKVFDIVLIDTWWNVNKCWEDVTEQSVVF